MIINFEGNVRSGKTSSAKYMLNCAVGSNRLYNVYSNIHFTDIEYINLKLLKDLDDIYTSPNIFFIDEIWKNLDSRRSNTILNQICSDEVLQSGHKQVDIISTSQMHGSIDKRYRFVVNQRIIPRIISYHPYERYNGRRIPISIKLIICDCDRRKISYKIIKDIRPILETYDTYELVRREQVTDLNQIVLKYCEWDGTKKSLQSKLDMIEGLRRSDCIRIADYVVGCKSPYEVCEGIGKSYEDYMKEKEVMKKCSVMEAVQENTLQPSRLTGNEKGLN